MWMTPFEARGAESYQYVGLQPVTVQESMTWNLSHARLLSSPELFLQLARRNMNDRLYPVALKPQPARTCWLPDLTGKYHSGWRGWRIKTYPAPQTTQSRWIKVQRALLLLCSTFSVSSWWPCSDSKLDQRHGTEPMTLCVFLGSVHLAEARVLCS